MEQVTFIDHSCFLVEFDHSYLLFDYFSKEAVEQVAFDCKLPELKPEKHLYVFASHRHKDHFTLEVLQWVKQRENITYILSKDIRLGRNYLIKNQIDPKVKEKIHFMTFWEHKKIDGLVIDTLKSTDEGVAFVVEAEGKRLFHAGDLHWWNWGQRGEIYCETIGKAFQKEIRKIQDKHFDFAFVVLDPRLMEGAGLGLEYFLKTIDADVVFPMHLWKEYELIQRIKSKPQFAPYAHKIVDMERNQIQFQFD